MNLKILSSFLIFTIFIFSISLVFADGEGWLTGWDYRKSHTIEQTDNAPVFYQISIKIDFGSGADSGDTVYLDGKCKTDFGDIRFTDNDGDTLLDYWLESKTDSNNAIFWFKTIDDLDADNIIIYVYYGNNEVSTTSDGDDTFLFFDNFLGDSLNTDKWEDDVGYASVTGGILTYDNAQGVDKWIMMNEVNYPYFESPYGYALGGLVDIEATDFGHWGFREVSHGTDLVIFYHRGNTLREQIFTRNTATSSDEGDWTGSQYNRFEITLDGSYATYYTDFVEESNSPHSGGTIIPNADLGIIFNIKGGYIKADWVYVRKFVDPEPVNGIWGEEEEEEEPEEDLFFITFQLNEGGTFEVNGTIKTNSTVSGYDNQTVLVLRGIVKNASYNWLNFTWLNGNSTVNDYDYVISSNNTIWCYFIYSVSVDYDSLMLIAIIASVSCFFLLITIKKRK